MHYDNSQTENAHNLRQPREYILVLHVGHSFRCAIGCNKIEGFIHLCGGAYL